jgi:hypothetical protein
MLEANMLLEAKTLVRGLTIAGAFALAPFAFSPEQGAVVVSTACAQDPIREEGGDGTCCPERGSLCGMNGQTFSGYYYRRVGSCL